MAKVKNCEFCGKEMQAGFFKGEDQVLVVGTNSFTCCEACYNKYAAFAKKDKKRFELKIDNYKYVKKIGLFKSLGDDVRVFFEKYFEEGQEYVKRSQNLAPTESYVFYHVDNAGHFWVNEAPLTGATSANASKDQLRTLKKNEWDKNSVAFTKDDVAKLDFYIDKLGNQSSMFNTFYDVYICFNDKDVITYKPTFTKTVVPGGFFIGAKKRAIKYTVAMLEVMKELTGIEAEIVQQKKKFR